MKEIPVTRSSMPPFKEYAEEIRSLWETRWLTNAGEKHRALETALRDYLQAEQLSLFTNGHLALETALLALPLHGEVITTPFTFASTTQAIVRAGLTPVFCDINPRDFTIDVDRIESLITERTSAILAVHVYGNLCDVEGIEAIARKHHLKVIYDAAHAFGESYHGRSVAAFGDFSMFSFHATKVFHTIEGGCLTYRDERMRQKVEAMKNFGQYTAEIVGEIGFNAKMNEFQAAMGLCNLRHVEEEIAKRKVAVAIYRERLSSRKGIYVSPLLEGMTYNYSYFPILLRKDFGMSRDALCEHLARKGIFARKYFYPATNDFACYQGRFPLQQTPVAKEIADSVLTLPLYADLTPADATYVCECIEEVC